MNKVFISSFKVSYAEGVNTFIYFLKRIPLLGRVFKDSLYEDTGIKMLFGIFAEFFKVIKNFIFKFVYVFIVIFVPAFLMSETKINSRTTVYFINIFFFMSFFLGSIFKTVTLVCDKKSFDMIVLLKTNAKKYYIGQIIFKRVQELIYFTPAVLIIGTRVGVSAINCIMLILELVLLRFISEAALIFIFNISKKSILNSTCFTVIAALIAAVFAYVLPILKIFIDFKVFLFSIIFFLAVILFSALSVIYIFRYNEYTFIAKKILNKDILFNTEAVMKNATFRDVKIDEKDLKKGDLNTGRFDNKKGFEYFNSLFLLRYKKIIFKPIIYRAVIIFIVFAGLCTYAVLKDSSTIFKGIYSIAPLLVFIMFIISTGERFCKALFFNCDINMLRHSYYRQPKVILSNYKSRLKILVLLNIIPAIEICLGFVILFAVKGYFNRLYGMLPIFISIICLSLFFSIHNLFMYYILQPYTKDLAIQSPAFKFIKFIIYTFSYLCMDVIKKSSYYFTAGIIIVTVIYMITALIITYKRAPYTFKLK